MSLPEQVILVVSSSDVEAAKSKAMSENYIFVVQAVPHMEGYDYGSNAASDWLTQMRAEKFMFV